jgi:hypothetical protein
MYDMSEARCMTVSVRRRILATYVTGQDDGRGPSTYLEEGSSRRPSPRRAAAVVHRNRAYFIGVDTRGREFEIILAADDQDENLWHAIHALQTRFRKNW